MTEQYANFFCSRDVVMSLVKAGVPANSKWGALILYMRSISEYDYLSAEQKQQMQDLVMQIVRERDYSEVRFKEFVRLQEQILYKPWNKKLEEAFRETVGLIEHMRSQNIQRAKEVKDLRETTINTVRDQNALENIVTEIRAAFEKVITHMEQDTRDLIEMSYTDPLTKLNNRRAFDRYFQAALAEHVVTGKPMSLLFFDIDHFKSFNDSYGHRIGDQALVTVAGKLMGYAHKYGTSPNRSFFPARFGGEEFCVLAVNCGADAGMAMAERIRGIVEALRIEYNGRALRITVSIGVCLLDPRLKAKDLLDDADKALYASKAGGRNRCTLFRPGFLGRATLLRAGR